MATKREMYEKPNHFCGLEDGEYQSWKVHADGSKFSMLAQHLPNTDPSFRAAIVEDGYVVGVVREYADAHPVVAAPAAAPPATQSPISVDPEPEPEPQPDQPVPEPSDEPEQTPTPDPAPKSRNWWTATHADVTAELKRRGLSTVGQRKERIARLEA